jgi:hypothetical protein
MLPAATFDLEARARDRPSVSSYLQDCNINIHHKHSVVSRRSFVWNSLALVCSASMFARFSLVSLAARLLLDVENQNTSLPMWSVMFGYPILLRFPAVHVDLGWPQSTSFIRTLAFCRTPSLLSTGFLCISRCGARTCLPRPIRLHIQTDPTQPFVLGLLCTANAPMRSSRG